MNQATKKTEVAVRSLSEQLQERDITPAQWHTLTKVLYPGAAQASVLLVTDYCKVRGLDVMKKPCHIVPMRVKEGDQWVTRDVILPGIYELRTTAQRTGEYMGHSKPEYGPIINYKGVEAPEWCSLVMYRWNPVAKQRCEYPVTVYFEEAVGETFDKQTKQMVVNARWVKGKRQMLTKCTEAAGLREAFPDAIGGEMSAEEMTGDEHYEPAPVRQVTLATLTGDVIEHEPEPKPAPKTSPMGYTIGEVRNLIATANSQDEIEEAMDLIASVTEDDPAAAKTLRKEALAKYQAITA